MSIVTLSIMTFTIKIPSVMGLFVTLSRTVLSALLLSVVYIVMLSVILLNVVMLSVLAPDPEQN